MSDHTVCVDNVFDFTTAFLFSLEGQTTIGYGSRGPTIQCWFVVVVQFIQWLLAYAFDSLVVTIIFTKLARPKYRAKSIEFSKSAVINERDGKLVLIVRVANLRDSLMLDVTVSGKLLKTRRTPDGEWLALEERNVEFDNSKALFLTQPVDYIHTIDERSPLYELSQSILDRDEEPLELVVIMSGIVEGTGMACQNRIEPQKDYQNKTLNRFQVDYKMFHEHYLIEPLMSGRSAEDRDFDRESERSSTTQEYDTITHEVAVRANILANMMTNTSI
ncbi:Oidioi.mRNA.OKI2018_I69.chr2.g5878.t1.cds [Oikopleura dioica]|uniref:Oidioi.mRNA.OKI2018_I69.chr2.g5878.t1.cds n=1 Tax=Oikopleura dioica TaxID=34765 RepID=A0ABN7T891_OIKDI|nr:Oidioi.mRNA.OKI2018_I69.chr2.g5878.t1.cds [Oikopleura dioica]